MNTFDISSKMPAHGPSLPKWQVAAGWVLSCATLLVFLPSAFFKIAQPGDFLAQWSQIFPARTARPIGFVELVCVALYFVPSTRVLGAILATGYLGGAVATHVSQGEFGFFAILLGIVLWAGLFLRMAQLRILLPTVSSGS